MLLRVMLRFCPTWVVRVFQERSSPLLASSRMGHIWLGCILTNAMEERIIGMNQKAHRSDGPGISYRY